MATKRQILAAMLATPLSLATPSDAGMPDFESPPGLYKDAAVPGVGAACAVLSLDGAQIRGRMFDSTMDLKDPGGRPIGTIESQDRGWVMKAADGSVVARAAESGDDERRTISVTDCAGAPAGSITVTRAGWRGERVIEARDASGALVGTSGSVSYLQDSWSLGPIRYEDDHWLLDSWRVRGAGDARLAAFAAMANSAANRRESQSRNRERIGDRPGRGDR